MLGFDIYAIPVGFIRVVGVFAAAEGCTASIPFVALGVGSTAKDARVAGVRHRRTGRVGGYVAMRTVAAPFPDVAVDVVETPRVRRVGADYRRACVSAACPPCRGVVAGVVRAPRLHHEVGVVGCAGDVRAVSPLRRTVPGARRELPLRLARKIEVKPRPGSEAAEVGFADRLGGIAVGYRN